MKKILRVFLILILLVNSIFVHISNFTFAASLDVSSLRVNNVAASSFNLNPWDVFSLDLSCTNNLWYDLKNVFMKFDFSNNWFFSYDGVNNRARVNLATVMTPVPASYYSSIAWFGMELTNSSYPTLANTKRVDFIRVWASLSWFTVSSDITSYTNTLSVYCTWKDSATDALVTWPTSSAIIYANVKPHITDYYFEKNWTPVTSVKADWQDSIDLVVKVKDFNWCTNIDGWTVISDLTTLWLSASEPLNYTSCDADGKTAIFKKTWITTLASIWLKSFWPSNFTATDENANVRDYTDSKFNSVDRTTNLDLSVESAAAPTVTISSVTDSYIWSSLEQTSTISFSADKSWTWKVIVWTDNTCSAWTVIRNNFLYSSWTTDSSTVINVSSLSEWQNTIYICVEWDWWAKWAASTIITKDTVSPSVYNMSISKSSVVTENSSISFKCSEWWSYRVCKNDPATCSTTFQDWTSTSSWTTNSVTLLNWDFSVWANTIYAYCKDDAWNDVYSTWLVTKIEDTPSMSWATMNLQDLDTDYNGIDGRDVYVTWDNSTWLSFANFESWRIYILPSNVSFNSWTHTAVKIIASWAVNYWTWTDTILNDSAWTPLVSWWTYRAYISIMSSAWRLWDAWSTSDVVLYGDVVQNAQITAARFTSGTNLELTTDTILDTNISSHSWSMITYVINGTTYTWVSIASVNNQILNVTVPLISSTAATWYNLVISTWAIHSTVWWYNNYFSSWSLVIRDWQKPVISNFSKTTSPSFSSWSLWYYKGTIYFSYTLSEDMTIDGNTYIRFARSWGNLDVTPHYYYITDSTTLSAGNRSVYFSMDNIGLVCWSTYNVDFYWSDKAFNTSWSSVIWSVAYDNCGPTSPIPTNMIIVWTWNVPFTWAASTDDSWNWSSVKEYVLKVFTWSSCNTWNIYWTYTWTSVSKIVSLTWWNYSWYVYANDNMSNTWTVSSCDDFTVDLAVPTISNATITDQTILNSSYTKNWDTISIQATIPNTNSSKIWLNMQTLAWSASYNNVQCSSPWHASISCSYSNGVVTYTFPIAFAGWVSEWVRQVVLTAQNTNWLNDQTQILSITVDNSSPSVSSSTFVHPNWWEVLWWTTQSITWTNSLVTDNIWLSYIKLEYATGAWIWNLIWTWSNNGAINWSISSLQSRSDYLLRLTAYDLVWNSSSDQTNSTFSIDLVTPTVPSNTITTPNWNQIVKWWSSYNITWNTAWITDNIWLSATPISLSYSIDGGTNWSSIASSLNNNWTYSWTVPSLNLSTAKVRLIATDSPWNTWQDVSDSNFIIDSTNPSLSVTYAGWWWTTPLNNSKINNSGIQISAWATDSYLNTVNYEVADITTWTYTYWNNSSTSWLWTTSWNVLCTDGTSLWTNSACATINQTITPTIIDWRTYRLTVRAIDEAWNIATWTSVNYIWDTTAPVLSISNSSGSYFSWNITISWTSSDTWTSVTAVSIRIMKWSEYWNWTSWVWTQQTLSTSTSNSYANWSYNFTAPGTDTDWQVYNVQVLAYDNAYTTNNYSTSSINVILDKQWPVVASNIFTFNTSNTYSGWNSFTVTWNTAWISTTWSSIAANPITLSYNFTWTLVTIASNIANNGSYTFTLPGWVDTTTAKIIMTAYDTLWNISNIVNSSNFVIDSLPPTIQTVETMDQDANWQIDWFLVTFSESIRDATVNTWNFSMSAWWVITTFATASSTDDNKIVINFNNTGSTATTPTLYYTLWTIEDLVWNKLATVSTWSIDSAVPRISNAEIFDSNIDWKLDKIELTFSESMWTTTTLAWLTLNNAYDGMSLSSLTVSSNKLNLYLTDSTDYNTATWSLSLTLNNTIYTDLLWNIAWNFTNMYLVDKAYPVKISWYTKDTNSDYKIDRLDVTFSESLTWIAWSDYIISSLAVGSSYTWTVATSGNQLLFYLVQTSDDNDTSQTPTFAYSWINLRDVSWNLTPNFGFTFTDSVSPKVLLRETVDNDSDWHIDNIKYTFSESLNDSFAWLNVSVAWYVVSGYSSVCNWSSANDSKICVSIEEKTIYDTDVNPSVQILWNSSLWDSAWNLIVVEWSTSSTLDKVWPVIVWARYSEWNAWVDDDKLYVTLSETYSWNTLDQTLGWVSNDFVLSWWWAFAASSQITNINWNELEITMWAWATALTVWVSQVSILSWAIADTNNNLSPVPSANNYIWMSASVVINEIMFSNTGDNQYIELRNLWVSAVSISGWVIENAWWNGVNITIPSWTTIAWSWYYLIAKVAKASSILNIDPDLIDSSLNLNPNSQNNLVLKDWSITYDTVKSNPWPYWSGSIEVSMERNQYPWNWTLAASWYDAAVTSGFDWWSTAKWTPKSVNIFDWVAPSVSSYSPQNLTLLPINILNIKFNYSDNGWWVWISTWSATVLLEKWNGSSYIDVTSTWLNISSKIVTDSQATYPTTWLDSGKYRVTFDISDKAWNYVEQIFEFYIDRFEVTINGSSVDIWNLQPWTTVTSTWETEVTIKTLWAWFTLNTNSILTPNQWVDNIYHWNGTTWYWMDIDFGTWYSWLLTWVNNTNLISVASWSIDTNWNQKTYTYRFKYWAKIDNLQSAWYYSWVNSFTVLSNY